MVLVEVTTLYRGASRQQTLGFLGVFVLKYLLGLKYSTRVSGPNLDVSPPTTVTWTLDQDDRYAVVTGGTGAKAEVMGIYKPAHDRP